MLRRAAELVLRKSLRVEFKGASLRSELLELSARNDRRQREVLSTLDVAEECGEVAVVGG